MAKRVVLELGSSTNFVYSLKGAVSKDSSLCRIWTDGERRSVYERNYHYRKT